MEPGNIQDRTAASSVLSGLEPLHPRIKKIFADGGYLSSALSKWLQKTYRWHLEIVKRRPGPFKVLRKRWIVERTFAGLDRYRRWSKDSEYLVSSSENMIYIAMIQLMLRRLAINST